MQSKLFVSIAVTLLLTGCSSLYDTSGHTRSDIKVTKPFTLEQKWWSDFHDPILNEFSDRILADNIDIKIAQTRLSEARALTSVTRSGLFPDVAATASAGRGNTSSAQPESLSQVGFDVNWEIDLFNRTGSKILASEARARSQEATIDDVKNTIIADLSRAVIQWRQAQDTIRQTNELIKSQTDQVNLLDSRAEAGLIDSSFSERAKAQIAQTQTQIPLAEAAAKTAQYQIERLLNVQDNSIELMLASATPLQINIPAPQESLNTPLEMIKDRPDIRAAKANLLAAQAGLSEAEAALWPKLTLGAFFGVQDGTDALRVASNPIWSFASAITAPVLNFGRLRGNIDAANARSEQAILIYENTSRLAVQETKTALSDYLNGLNGIDIQRKSLKHRQDTVTIAKERFDRGLTDMTDLTTAQTELDQATLNLISKQTETAIAYIRLQKAFGIAAVVSPEEPKNN